MLPTEVKIKFSFREKEMKKFNSYGDIKNKNLKLK